MTLPKFLFQAKENLVEKPWGGEWISLLKGFRKSGIGESWEFSAHPSNPSEVLLAGQSVSVTELIAKHREELMGKLADKYTTFPILVRIVDVEGFTDIHVHPSDKVASTFGETESGREEGLLMIGGGIIYAGWKDDMSIDEFDSWLDEIESAKDILEKLNRFELSPHDTLHIPSGILHSIEKGRFIEVSTNSILTYVLHDGNEKTSDFEKVKKALKFKKSEEFELKGKKGLLDTDRFKIEILEVAGAESFSTDGVFHILISVDGYSFLKSDGEIVDLHKGYSCLIPAATENYEIQSDKASIVRIIPK
jgi:mannose-6-phosphate isomerase